MSHRQPTRRARLAAVVAAFLLLPISMIGTVSAGPPVGDSDAMIYRPGTHEIEVDEESEQELLEHRQIRGAVVEAEREALLQMRERGAVTDEVFRRVERDLDLEELRMEA